MQCQIVVLHRNGDCYHGDARVYDPHGASFMSLLSIDKLTPLLRSGRVLVVEFNGTNHFSPWVQLSTANAQSRVPNSPLLGNHLVHGDITRTAADTALKAITRSAITTFPRTFPNAGAADMPVLLQLDAVAFRTLQDALPHMPAGTHRRNINNVITAAIKSHDVVLLPLIPFRGLRNNAPHGRTKYLDIHGKTNSIIFIPASVRTALLSSSYDEVDLKRSHISNVVGAWRKAHPRAGYPGPIARFLSGKAGRDALERDMQKELDAARPHLLKDYEDARNRNDDKANMLKTQYEKSLLRPKDVYSAMINCNSDISFPVAMGGLHPHLSFQRAIRERERVAPTICALNTAIRSMRANVLTHPVTRRAADGIAPTDKGYGVLLSTSMFTLEDTAVRTASRTLREQGIPVVLTVNDSAVFARPRESQAIWSRRDENGTTLGDKVHSAVTQHMGYSTLEFEHHVALTKPGGVVPTMAAALNSIGVTYVASNDDDAHSDGSDEFGTAIGGPSAPPAQGNTTVRNSTTTRQSEDDATPIRCPAAGCSKTCKDFTALRHVPQKWRRQTQ
jgi:hypothetical protein